MKQKAITAIILCLICHDQILTAVGNGGLSGFVLEIGEQETHSTWDDFKQSVLRYSHLNLNQVGDMVVEYQGVSGLVKLQYQQGLPKVWRYRLSHDWQKHYAVYQNAQGGKAPIYEGWKQGKLEVAAGGYQFTNQP